MAIRKRTNKQMLKPYYTPKPRRGYVDYDYLDKLSDAEQDWLGRFTAEFYGGDFIINNTYIMENDVMTDITPRDLRKYMSAHKFYKDENGEFTDSLEYKYSKTLNIHTTDAYRKEIRTADTANKADIMAWGINAGTGDEGFIESMNKSGATLYNLNPEKMYAALTHWAEELGIDNFYKEEDEYTPEEIAKIRDGASGLRFSAF